MATLSLSFAVGHLVARAAKLPRNYQALKPALGMATILITSSLAYRIGLNENAISLSTWTIGIIGSIILDRKAIASGFSHFKIGFMFLRKGSWTLTIYVIGVAYLVLPGIFGKSRFQVFQGNYFDHFNYLGSALSYKTFTSSQILNASSYFSLNHPLTMIASSLIRQRPAVSIALDTVSVAPHISIVDGAYGFLLAQLAILAVTLTLYAIKFKNRLAIKFNMSLILIIAFIIGFWGQYLFDSNAWSSLACLSICAAIPIFFLEYFSTRKPWAAIVTVILFVALLVTYPEAFIFFLPSYALFVLIICWKNKLPLFQNVLRFGAGFFGVLLLSLLANPFVLKYAIAISKFAGTDASSPWANYFEAYLRGNSSGVGFSNFNVLRTGPMGVLGLYQIAPSTIQLASIAGLSIFLVNILCLALLVYFLATLVISFKSRPMNGFIVLLILSGLAVAVRDTIWTAGKALAYFVPLFFIALFYFLASKMDMKGILHRSLLGSFVMLWVIIQFSFASTRITDARTLGYAHRPPAYIAGQDINLKGQQDWNFPNLNRYNNWCHVYKLNIADPFQNYYAKMKLVDLGKEYYDVNPITASLGGGDIVGQMNKIPDLKTCQISILQQGNMKRFFLSRSIP